MALTVATDLVVINNADDLTGAIGINNLNAPGTNDTDVKVQGASSRRARLNGTGVSGSGHDTGAANVDVTDQHLFVWVQTLDAVQTLANNGWRYRIATDAAATANFGETTVGGSDTDRIRIDGFSMFCVDPLQPFDFTTGTPPAITAVRTFAILADHLSASSRETWFQDQLARGTSITVTGGAATPRGSNEIATNDDTNGRGMFKSINGAYYVLCKVILGDVTAATNSTFDDTNQVWIFEDQAVSASFYKIEFVGGTGTNRETFGTSSGTGFAKEASGGNTFKSAGVIPFRVEAIDADVTAEMFGCSLTGPSVIRKDALRNYKFESPAATFTDDTRDANDAGANDFSFIASAINTGCYWGHDERFYEITVDVGTAGTGAYTVVWEYWNGSAWAALTDLTDGTGAFKTAGVNTVTYSIPDSWAKTTVDTDNRYWIRARKGETGSLTITPLGDETSVSLAGDIRWEQTNAEAIRCTFTNMGTARIRNGAKLKKCTLASSVSVAKYAALDLGDTNPATDAVRDIQFSGGVNAVVLKPTANRTYDFQDYRYASLTGKKVRIEAPSGRLVTINVLNGGDAIANPGDLQLVGGIVSGDVTIVNNTVDTTITILDGRTSPPPALQNVRVLVEASDATGDLPFDDTVTITRVTTTATVAHTAHGMATGDKVAIRKVDQPEYRGVKTISNVSANAYDYTVSGSPATPATGTIKANGVVLEGLTDVSGQIKDTRAWTLAQPIKGVARLSTASPRFKQGKISGTISTTAGLASTLQLVIDE
jgi:hypothetical protein